MTDLSDSSVQNAITAVVQSASIHLDYVGDLQHGYHNRDAKQQLKSLVRETTDNKNKNDTKQQNNTSPIASTATGLPDPAVVTSAIDQLENKEQDANEDPNVASTAIGLPASEPVIRALEESGGGGTGKDDTLQNTVVTSAPSSAAARNVIDKLASDSRDEPRPNPSKMKHNQQEPEKSCKSSHDSSLVENVKLSGDSDHQGVQHNAASGATDVDDRRPLAGSAGMQNPPHTVIDGSVTSMGPIPVEPVVENIVANMQNAEKPVAMEQEIIQDPYSIGKTVDTPTDAKTEPIAQKQVVVTEDPAADEIKVEQKVSSSSNNNDDMNKKMEEMAIADIKTEGMLVVEEPATVDDLKTKPMDEDGLLVTNEPIKKDGTVDAVDVNVEQQSTAPIDGQSRSMESTSLEQQQGISPEKQDKASAATPTGQSQDQLNAPKTSKCVMM